MTNAEKLAQAQFAYHQLMTGSKKVTVKYDETSVTYNTANLDQLRLYIAELQNLEGITPTSTRGEPFQVTW